jgi:hypothetical protein
MSPYYHKIAESPAPSQSDWETMSFNQQVAFNMRRVQADIFVALERRANFEDTNDRRK